MKQEEKKPNGFKKKVDTWLDFFMLLSVVALIVIGGLFKLDIVPEAFFFGYLIILTFLCLIFVIGKLWVEK